LAHDLRLLLAIGPRQQKACHTARRANYHPTFGATIVRHRRNVLNKLELQDVHEEVDRRLIFPHNQRYQFEVRHQSLPISDQPLNSLKIVGSPLGRFCLSLSAEPTLDSSRVAASFATVSGSGTTLA